MELSSRSRFFAVALAFAMLAVSCGECPRPPNVVLIVMDTTRADRCSFSGYDRDTTPRLAALAREATVYLDAWSPSGWTAPAHASLFSGLRPEHHGLFRGNREFLGPEIETIAERLRGAGYRTACFSNNDAVSRSTGLAQGFEVFVPLYEDSSRPYPWAVETHGRALRWALDQHRRGAPFFLFINDMEPHLPYTPPEETAARFRRAGTSEDMVEWGRHLLSTQAWQHNLGISRLSRPQIEHASDLYDAEIRCLDELIGALVQGLRSEGILDETLFIVTADHGENLGEHGLMDHVFSLHRTIRHVPLLIRYPARFERGREVTEVVRLEDVPPTILEVCGLPPPGGLDGQSLLGETTGRISRAMMGPPREVPGSTGEDRRNDRRLDTLPGPVARGVRRPPSPHPGVGRQGGALRPGRGPVGGDGPRRPRRRAPGPASGPAPGRPD